MAIFPGKPGLAGTRMSPFWILLDLRMMEVVVTTGAMRHAKLHSKRNHQQSNTQLCTGQMPFLLPSQQCQSTVEAVQATEESSLGRIVSGESYVGRDVHRLKRPWVEMPMGRNVLPSGEVSMGRYVRGVKSPDTCTTDA